MLISAEAHARLPEAERGRLGCAAEPREATVMGRQGALFLYPVAVP